MKIEEIKFFYSSSELYLLDTKESFFKHLKEQLKVLNSCHNNVAETNLFLETKWKEFLNLKLDKTNKRKKLNYNFYDEKIQEKFKVKEWKNFLEYQSFVDAHLQSKLDLINKFVIKLNKIKLDLHHFVENGGTISALQLRWRQGLWKDIVEEMELVHFENSKQLIRKKLLNLIHQVNFEDKDFYEIDTLDPHVYLNQLFEKIAKATNTFCLKQLIFPWARKLVWLSDDHIVKLKTCIIKLDDVKEEMHDFVENRLQHLKQIDEFKIDYDKDFELHCLNQIIFGDLKTAWKQTFFPSVYDNLKDCFNSICENTSYSLNDLVNFSQETFLDKFKGYGARQSDNHWTVDQLFQYLVYIINSVFLDLNDDQIENKNYVFEFEQHNNYNIDENDD